MILHFHSAPQIGLPVGSWWIDLHVLYKAIAVFVGEFLGRDWVSQQMKGKMVRDVESFHQLLISLCRVT